MSYPISLVFLLAVLAGPQSSYAQVGYPSVVNATWSVARIVGVIFAILFVFLLLLLCLRMAKRRNNGITNFTPNFFNSRNQRPPVLPYGQGPGPYGPPPPPPPPARPSWGYNEQYPMQEGAPPPYNPKDSKAMNGNGGWGSGVNREEYQPPIGPPPPAHTRESDRFVGGFRNGAS